MDLRSLLLIDSYYGGHLRDNDSGFPGSQGALVVDSGGLSILRIGASGRRLVIPVFDGSAVQGSEFVDRLLWAAASLREGGVVGAAPRCLVASLGGQLGDFGLAKLYAKPGTLAWERALAEAGGLPLVAALGFWADGWALGGRVVLGLPHPEFLGVSLQGDAGVQGLAVFPRFVAAAYVA